MTRDEVAQYLTDCVMRSQKSNPECPDKVPGWILEMSIEPTLVTLTVTYNQLTKVFGLICQGFYMSNTDLKKLFLNLFECTPKGKLSVGEQIQRGYIHNTDGYSSLTERTPVNTRSLGLTTLSSWSRGPVAYAKKEADLYSVAGNMDQIQRDPLLSVLKWEPVYPDKVPKRVKTTFEKFSDADDVFQHMKSQGLVALKNWLS